MSIPTNPNATAQAKQTEKIPTNTYGFVLVRLKFLPPNTSHGNPAKDFKEEKNGLQKPKPTFLSAIKN